ncbi:MAG: bifunctional demethylmenaquinone methyltransferase/2-methoxy-6-polyprenyl-1,4-benzoquinol methylase UbiE [Bacteroidota bacterium]|nr:bifunctional demethylmenaquinone methyltransferase/2-methoxy-6-polyprenyl-1,4-benzoquinol methylase UbiE [Bacteroidota bacterium]
MYKTLIIQGYAEYICRKIAHLIPITPYQKSDVSKKDQVTNMFDKIATKYDFLNSFLSLGIDSLWRKKAISLIVDKPQTLQILDVATGTASLAIEAAKKFPQHEITGIDLSENMLEKGQLRIHKLKLTSSINLLKGDSESLPFQNEIFDVVMVAFGVRNFEHLEVGLQEMSRVLKPGGQMIILEFSKPTFFPFKQLFQLYFKNILPFIGKVFSKDQRAYKYLFESVQQFPDYERFTAIMNSVNIKNATILPLTLGICCVYSGTK